jgi:GNAT superfamily N-acetyltransferase
MFTLWLGGFIDCRWTMVARSKFCRCCYNSPMPLPVLNIPNRRSDADLLRLFCRTESLWSDTLAEVTSLPSGSALTNRSLPNIAAANRMLDAVIPPGASAEQAIAEVAAHFDALGVRCLEWWPNLSQPAEPLAAALLAAAFVPHKIEVLVLSSPARPADLLGPELSIYSARAGLRHARVLIEEMAADLPHPDQQTEAMLLHLDDPHYELLLAAESGEPVGMVAVFAAGDIGRIESLFVRHSHRRRGIGRVLLNRAIELSARSRFVDVLAESRQLHPATETLRTSAGFRRVGNLVVHKKSS